ncbi:hypothetical protein AAG570_000175 [Ranatra chinensis]|uniref:GDP-fucose protein O-fucosyltransferase 2 n=1 Tax=Ranatra chinensis TaxID=642074 RepID=A0ABD0ZHI7_9HEMI
MRMAIFVRNVAKLHGDWHLVLPSWHHLYHWRTIEAGEQNQLPWSKFFDIESLAAYVPVVEMHHFLKENGGRLDQVYVLQHFKNAFSENWDWEDKWNIEECELISDRKQIDGRYLAWFWGYKNMSADRVNCVSFQGPASQILRLLLMSPEEAVMVDYAEVALHERFGDAEYWRCRRSMRFNRDLVEEATRFRAVFLNSSDVTDGTLRPRDWRVRKTRGGPYLGVHLRRQDFVVGEMDEERVPISLREAAAQIASSLRNLSLSTVFVATDAPSTELNELKQLLVVDGFKMVHYDASVEDKQKYKDGGLAIIDQIICSHARHFIGTHESTFSFRIQEEREIMGFPLESTFNRLCPRAGVPCTQPTRWKIVF